MTGLLTCITLSRSTSTLLQGSAGGLIGYLILIQCLGTADFVPPTGGCSSIGISGSGAESGNDGEKLPNHLQSGVSEARIDQEVSKHTRVCLRCSSLHIRGRTSIYYEDM
jgi:hypothetical protein